MNEYDERTDKIGEMLESEDKQISEIQPHMRNILSRLFRKLLLMEGINKLKWNSYMQSYVRLIESNTNKVSVHGNTTKALAKTEFTWNNFTQAIRFLQTKKLRIIIERTDFNGRVTTVEETVEFNKPAAYQEDEEQLKAADKAAEDTKYRGLD